MAKAEVLQHDFDGVEIEEVHFAIDGSGRIIYKGRSKFSSFGRKTDEVRLEGQKIFDPFQEWGF